MSIFKACVLLLATLVFTTGPVFAEDHSLSTLTGPGIDLKTYDHAFAGSIRDFVAWGNMDHDSFTSELIMKRNGTTIKAVFGQKEEAHGGKFIGGEIRSSQDSVETVTALRFVKIDRDNSTIVMNINGEDVNVVVTADSFENNHFQNPTYKTEFRGQAIEFTLKGEACFGYSTHLLFMILGAMVH